MKKNLLILTFLFIGFSGCGLLDLGGGSRKGYSNSSSAATGNCPSGYNLYKGSCVKANTTPCSVKTYSDTGNGPCTVCPANSTNYGTGNTDCTCTVSGYTWSNDACTKSIACAANTWSSTGYVVSPATSCSSCATSIVANSLGTSNAAHTQCNCASGYSWSAGECTGTTTPTCACTGTLYDCSCNLKEKFIPIIFN